MSRNRAIAWASAVYLFMVAVLPAATAMGEEERFFKANELYKEGRFEDAARQYETLIQAGLRNGHIYYNLGNAYFRLNDLGRAILNYERARIHLPRDADLEFNLRYAKDRSKDAIPESQDMVETTFFWLQSLNLGELFWVFGVTHVLFWCLLAVRLYAKTEWSYYVCLVLFATWLIMGLSLGLKWYQQAGDDRVVVLSPEADVLAGPNVEDTILFKLHAGAVIHYERSEEGWSLVRLPDKKRGWIPSQQIAHIASAPGSGK